MKSVIDIIDFYQEALSLCLKRIGARIYVECIRTRGYKE